MPDNLPAPPAGPPQAIVVDSNLTTGETIGLRALALKNMYATLLGAVRISGVTFPPHSTMLRPVDGNSHVVGPARLYPHDHPDAGKDAYEWWVARKGGDGKYAPVLRLESGEADPAGEVLLGYLKPDPYGESEEGAASIRAGIDARIAAAREERELAATVTSASATAKKPAKP